jgi:hypothetical protein
MKLEMSFEKSSWQGCNKDKEGAENHQKVFLYDFTLIKYCFISMKRFNPLSSAVIPYYNTLMVDILCD